MYFSVFSGVLEIFSVRRLTSVSRQNLVHAVLPRVMRSAAGGAGGDGGVNVKMLAEQNVQLKEALKRLHNHSIAEKTDVSVLVWTSVLLCLTQRSA